MSQLRKCDRPTSVCEVIPQQWCFFRSKLKEFILRSKNKSSSAVGFAFRCFRRQGDFGVNAMYRLVRHSTPAYLRKLNERHRL